MECFCQIPSLAFDKNIHQTPCGELHKKIFLSIVILMSKEAKTISMTIPSSVPRRNPSRFKKTFFILQLCCAFDLCDFYTHD